VTLAKIYLDKNDAYLIFICFSTGLLNTWLQYMNLHEINPLILFACCYRLYFEVL